MKSIWAYISEQVVSASNLYVDETDISKTDNLLRLNDMVQYLGFSNKQAADSMAIRIRQKLVQAQLRYTQSDLSVTKQEGVALLVELDAAQQTIISYAKQCNRCLIMDEPPRVVGQHLWTGAKVHIEEGELGYRENGSRMWITLPAPYASFVSTVFLGIWKAAAGLNDYMTKYEYIGRPAEQVGKLIDTGVLLLDKTLYETLFGEAYCVIDDWKVRLMQQSR